MDTHQDKKNLTGVRWPQGPPHLALNPPYLFFLFFFGPFCFFLSFCFFCFFLFCFFCFVFCYFCFFVFLFFVFCFCFLFFFVFCFLFFVFWGGFKGQVRWPEGPPHLALNPPYLFLFCFVLFCFPFFVLNRKKPVFPARIGHFLFIFECLPLFLLSLFLASPFFNFSLSLSLSLSLSISLSLSLSLSLLLCFFLFVFLVCCLLFFFIVSFFVYLSSLLVFREEQHQNIKLESFYSSMFSQFLVSCLVFSLIFFLYLPFPDLQAMFFAQHQCIWFQNTQVTSSKTTIFGQEGGCNKTFFVNLCFAKCEKLSFFGGPLFCKLWLMFTKHYNNRCFSIFLNNKKAKHHHF